MAFANVYNELQQALERTIVQIYPDLPFRNGVFAPLTFDLAPGAQSVSIDTIKSFGSAALTSGESAKTPLIQVDITKTEVPVVMAVAGYPVGFQSERAMEFSGKASIISDNMVFGARRAIDEKLHFFAAYGEAALNCRGFFNNNNVPATLSAFNPNTATFSDWVTFLVEMVLRQGFGTRDSLKPSDVMMSRNMMIAASCATAPNDDSVSAINAAKSRLKDIKGYESIEFWGVPECDAAVIADSGAVGIPAGRDRVVCYYRDPMTLGWSMEKSIASMMPEKFLMADQNARLVYPFFSCTTPVQVHISNGMHYFDVVAAT